MPNNDVWKSANSTISITIISSWIIQSNGNLTVWYWRGGLQDPPGNLLLSILFAFDGERRCSSQEFVGQHAHGPPIHGLKKKEIYISGSLNKFNLYALSEYTSEGWCYEREKLLKVVASEVCLVKSFKGVSTRPSFHIMEMTSPGNPKRIALGISRTVRRPWQQTWSAIAMANTWAGLILFSISRCKK